MNNTPNAVVGNYVDQGWLQSLPQFFQPADARPALGRDAFLIPRDNLTIPQIVTRTTQGTNDRGFIDVSRGRFDTIRNRINNPSSYNDQLHPSDLTSGTGGIDNLNDLSRFGHPLPYSNGEDIGMTKFMARYEGKGAENDPLSSSYAVANMAGGYTANMEKRYAADRQIAKMMFDNYQKLKADINKRDTDAKARAYYNEQQQMLAKQFNAKFASGMMDESRAMELLDDETGSRVSQWLDDYDTNSAINMGETNYQGFIFEGDSDPFRMSPEEVFALGLDERSFPMPGVIYRHLQARDVTPEGEAFASTQVVRALAEETQLTLHEVGVLYRSPATLSGLIKNYNDHEKMVDGEIAKVNNNISIAAAQKVRINQGYYAKKEQIDKQRNALINLGNTMRKAKTNGLNSILLYGEERPFVGPIRNESDMGSWESSSTYSPASNMGSLNRDLRNTHIFGAMHSDSESIISSISGNTFNNNVDINANYTSPNSVVNNTDGGVPNDANDPNYQYPLVGKTFLDLDNLTDVEKQLQEGINTMRMLRSGAISKDKIQPSQLYANTYVAVPPPLRGSKFDTERFVPGSTIIRSSNINIDKQSYEREITDPRYRQFAKLGVEKTYDSVGRDNPDQTAYSAITTELESQRIGNRIDGNVENPADRLAQGNTMSMSLISGAGFNPETTPLIAPINEVRGNLNNEVSQKVVVGIKDIKTQNYLATKRVNKDPFIWM